MTTKDEKAINQMQEKIISLESRIRNLELKTRGLEPDLSELY